MTTKNLKSKILAILTIIAFTGTGQLLAKEKKAPDNDAESTIQTELKVIHSPETIKKRRVYELDMEKAIFERIRAQSHKPNKTKDAKAPEALPEENPEKPLDIWEELEQSVH